MQHLLRPDRAQDRRRGPRRRTPTGWASASALPFDLPTAVSQVTNGDGKQPGGFTDDVELANASYGQAETFVTPLQMALVASTVANGGELMQPRLVTAMTGKQQRDADDRPEVDGPGHLDDRRAGDHDGDGRRGRGRPRPAVHDRAPRSRASRPRASPGRPNWAARVSHTRGSSGSPRPRTRRSSIAVIVEQAGRGGEVAAPIAGRPDDAVPEGWGMTEPTETERTAEPTSRPSRASRDR